MEPQPPAAAHPAQSHHLARKPAAPLGHDQVAHQRHQSARTERGTKSSHAHAGRDSVISQQPWSPHTSSPPSLRNSVSSASPPHGSLPEHRQPSDALRAQSITPPLQAHIDLEKNGYYALQSPRSPTHISIARSDVVYGRGEYRETGPEDKAWQILLYLSGPCALLSLALALWTLVAILMSIALAPFRLCTSPKSFASQITTFLAPALNLQLQLIYSCESETSYDASMLIIVHLFSPIIAFGVALGAWTSAAFWLFTSILGDPGGNGGYNDGKESILAVRNWWETWLSHGLSSTTT